MKPTRFYSNKQERKVAKVVNGRQTANSGATAFQKGDVIADQWLIECKTKTSLSKSITIQKNWIEKNNEEMFAMGKHYSAIAFNFGDDVNHYIISEPLFKQLVNYLKEEEK